MAYYENIFIARQDISAAQVDALADAFSEVITSASGQIHRREYWGLKSLQYRIKKNRKGHYVLMNIEADSDTMREMERQMRLNEDVLRHLTIRTEELPEGPSVMMQGRDRGDRERPSRDDDRPRRDSDAPRAAAAESVAETTTANEGDEE
ncbi:MAG: 30S ribosomal protein S6 [Alphaproteobacteria bacterium]|nr:30S ribosomal protein S6 [Alphaproteobacteria bacterium]